MTPYDTIRYPGLPYADTHPDHLAALATFCGMSPAPPAHCRVLEVGCGDGLNLVPMAYGLPDSSFVGIDLAGEAIEAARAFAQRTGVANVTFEALDLTRFPESAGAFDYIVAHGVYSWIPADVRDALMALIGRHLAPQGVGFVSYNALPGCHLRRMVWEMLEFHTGELPDPQARLTEARMLIRLLAHGNAQPDEYTQPLVTEAQRMENRLPALLFHDDLSPVNDPVYFHQFADHAARHGLQFLAESALVNSSYVGIAAEARGALATLDPITREQYLDFIKCRRFRQTLVCRHDVEVDRDPAPERMRPLTFTAARLARVNPPEANRPPPAPEPPAEPERDGDGTDLVHAILEVLRAAAPRTLGLDAIGEQLHGRPDAAQLLAPGRPDLPAVVLASLQAGLIQPHVASPRMAAAPGDRPATSEVVRAQLADGDSVTSLWHYPVMIDDEISRRLLPLMDGTRDRAELLAAAGHLDGFGTPDASGLDAHLRRLAALGLLIA